MASNLNSLDDASWNLVIRALVAWSDSQKADDVEIDSLVEQWEKSLALQRIDKRVVASIIHFVLSTAHLLLPLMESNKIPPQLATCVTQIVETTVLRQMLEISDGRLVIRPSISLATRKEISELTRRLAPIEVVD